MESFGEFYEWCEERSYTCNGVLTTTKHVEEVLALILSTGRAMRILNGNRYGLLIDKPRDYPVMILNSQNVLEATNQKGFDNLPDGFLVRFINADDGYQQTEKCVMAGGEPPKPESVIENLELPYITNREQAVKQAWYHLACRRLRMEIWNRKVSIDGYLIAIGDLVEVHDDTIVVGIG
jgi:predicted phage tail protein